MVAQKRFREVKQDFFLMAQLKAMNGGEITASRRLKKIIRERFTILIRCFIKKTMLVIGRTYLENVRITWRQMV